MLEFAIYGHGNAALVIVDPRTATPSIDQPGSFRQQALAIGLHGGDPSRKRRFSEAWLAARALACPHVASALRRHRTNPKELAMSSATSTQRYWQGFIADCQRNYDRRGAQIVTEKLATGLDGIQGVVSWTAKANRAKRIFAHDTAGAWALMVEIGKAADAHELADEDGSVTAGRA